jgi:hypothetical protein
MAASWGEILSNVVYEDFHERILRPSRLTQAATSTPSSNCVPPMTFVSNSQPLSLRQ